MFERGPVGQFSSPGILAKLRSTDLRSDGHGGDDGGASGRDDGGGHSERSRWGRGRVCLGGALDGGGHTEMSR